MTIVDRLQEAQYRAIRKLLSLRRPSPRGNADALEARRESLNALTLREAVAGDIATLAALHVATWNDTYAPLMTGPPVAVREQQWRQAFADPKGWFCYVLAHPSGELVGFTKALVGGELNKLFLTRDYQRMGLGRRLVGKVVQRFLAAGVPSMSAYVDPRNPSCGFFERLGGEWLIEPDGHVNFSWYVWKDLLALAKLCAV